MALADDSVPVPGPSVYRNYVTRVVKSYIWAIYKMIKMKTKILIIIIIIIIIINVL